MNMRGFSRIEAMRLSALRKLEILDSAPEPAFDRLVSMAASVLDAPMAILSFIDKDRQWLKAARGFAQIEAPRELSFCTHAIDEAGLCEILDASSDPRFHANPFVVGPPRLRYYAGARLLTNEGYPLGMLAVLDDRVRSPLSEDQRAVLESLAAIAMDELELRSARMSLSQKIRALEEAARESAGREAELIAAREIAETALQTEGRFLAHMSHELRTPLNGVLGMNALLLNGDLSPEQRNMAETMQESGRALLALIGDILDASRLHEGRLEIALKPFSVPELVERSLALVAASAAVRGARVQVCLEPGAPEQAVGDPLRLQQILVNLLGNSVKFGLKVDVRVNYRPTDAPSSGVLRFEVRDSGPGVDPDERQLIFEPFRQGKAGAEDGPAGVGLGLFIARQLAELMGGRIGVESARGAGAMFWFEAPVTGATPAAPERLKERCLGIELPDRRRNEAERHALRASHSTAGQGAAPRGEGVRVLLAEDDPTSARVAISLLTSAGGDVVHVPDGQEAVERAAAEPFDLIVLDIRMPRLNGIAAGARIRQTPGPNQNVPIYAVTAEATAQARAQALDCGFTDFITKPYQPEALGALVGRARPGAAAGRQKAPGEAALLDEVHVQLLEEAMSAPELRALLDLWAEEVSDQLDHVEAALYAPDALAAGVHKLKGAAVSFGAMRIAALAGELKGDPAPAKIATLRAVLASTHDELRRRVGK